MNFVNCKGARKRVKSIHSGPEIPIFDQFLHFAEFLEKAAVKLAEAREVGARLGVEATEGRVVDLILLRQVAPQRGKETPHGFPDDAQFAPFQGGDRFVEKRNELPMLLRDAFLERLRALHRADPRTSKRSWRGRPRGARI